MIVKEFISETNKNQMIATLLKHYKVQNTRMKYKSMKDHAHYVVEDGILLLSTRYKSITNRQVKEFLITIIHEIYHAMDAKKYGWKKFRDMWEYEANLITQGFYPNKSEPYDHNKHELEAEAFGQKHWKKWYNKFKKQGLV